MAASGRRKDPAQWVLAEEDEFGGQQHHFAWSTTELDFQLVPLAHVAGKAGVGFNPCPKVFCRSRCPDLHRRIDDRSAVAEHMSDNFAGLVRDVHVWLEAGSRNVGEHNSTVVVTRALLPARNPKPSFV